MHTTSHVHNHNYIKTVQLLHVIGSLSGHTSNGFVQEASYYLYYVIIQHINKINYLN
jgi:hypothetical protein